MTGFPTVPRAPRRAPLLASLVALAAAVACTKDSTSPPGGTLPRAALNGDYACMRMLAKYDGPQGLGWYTGSCTAYLNATSPSRADSIDTFPFQIRFDNSVFRTDFPAGTLQYDSAAQVAVVNYDERPDDVFFVSVVDGRIVFDQAFVPFDFTGDGNLDSLLLTFTKQ